MNEINYKLWDKIAWSEVDKKPVKKAFYSGPGFEPETIKEIWKSVENPTIEYLQRQEIPA